MNDHDPDQDLTSYALGELAAHAAAAVERRIGADPTARAEVERIRADAATLSAAFASEAAIGLGSGRLGQLAASAGSAASAASPGEVAARVSRATASIRLRPTRSMLVLAGGASLAAAALTIALVVPDGFRPQIQKDRLVARIHTFPAPTAHQARGGDDSRETIVYDAEKSALEPPYALELAVEQPSLDRDETQAPVSLQETVSQTSVSGTFLQADQPRAFMAIAAGGRVMSVGVGGHRAVSRDAGTATADGEAGTEAYVGLDDNPFHASVRDPLSTFSIDVDTAGYANVRRFLAAGRLPPRDAVRIEELINYFPYHAAPPRDDQPFAVDYEVGPCPWEPTHQLARLSLRGKDIDLSRRPSANLVFLLDVSGSMNMPDRLPWVQASMHMLVDQLRPDDHIAIVVYAGESGLVLPSTPASERATILAAIDALHPGGSTNGASGIQLAYQAAHGAFVKDGINRVVLCTDGDFNVGISDRDGLTRLLVDEAKGGVFLSVLGFGRGNLKDATMESMADHGNGNYAYIDTLGEARKVLVEQMSGTLMTIAKDVKIQVEFNPARIGGYRLIGYENRMLAARDFNDDRKDAGEIGAGHTVTALYELVPAGDPLPEPGVDPLKYQVTATPSAVGSAGYELMTVKLRSKRPDGDVSSLMEFPVQGAVADMEATSEDFRFAAAVAAFGMLLRESPHKGRATWEQVETLARSGIGRDEHGYRSEFVGLVRQAGALAGSAGR